jgi:ElaB/YqjD/DUF883 family membrane-anchored ribosome-binding protein
METNASITKVATNAHDALDRAAGAATGAAETAARKAGPAIDRAAEVAHRAVDKAAGIATPAADWVSTKTDVLREAPQRLAREGREIVVNNPWKAVGAAVLLGLLVGRILR